MVYRLIFIVAALVSAPVCVGEELQNSNEPKWGHSHLGSPYDEGPRTKPWVIEGIGKTHFPITTTHPEVQQWFDQAHTLLHGFWYYEAERSFRWCLKLDPDCAMAYWGLSRCAKYDDDRGKKFLKKASTRKEFVTERERDYIELWESKYAIGQDDGNRDELVRDFTVRFDKLLLKYPKDIEAKCLYWVEVPPAVDPSVRLQTIPYRYAMESLLQDVLKVEPNHVGALHYRIHNWDSAESHFVVDSCRRLRKAAPRSGHMQHMPGHVSSELGRWHEAAIAMDSATRIEKEYMHRRMILPEQNWDYRHNLSYLCYIQEQLGLVQAALFGAEQLLRGPHDVEGGHFRALEKVPLLRVLVKFERWQEILDEEQTLLGWDENNPIEQFFRRYARSYALLGTGAIDEATAEIEMTRKIFNEMMQKQKDESGEKSGPLTFSSDQLDSVLGWKVLELDGKLALARGNEFDGIDKLSRAAKLQATHWMNDPPQDPVFLYNSLGEAYLDSGRPVLAVEAFNQTLRTINNDGFALSGLVRAFMQLNEKEKATKAYRKLLDVWSDADRPNRWLDAARATGVSDSLGDARVARKSYKREVLDRKGYSSWMPAKAPDLTAFRSNGEKATLRSFSGRNVILIFYLGGECLHCMEQIGEANERAAKFQSHSTDIVAISKDDADTIIGYEKSGFNITLLTDPEFTNAKRFRSFDDFEEIELHSTILIDKRGRIHWSRHGGDPFMDFEFLENEVKRVNRIVAREEVSD